ncbi:zonular occludens toxin domain-containing protein [Ectopseudomonas alcaliphila]|uniref:Zonular occludens toxin (Zot) n=1 Tax=Ectopseudomonas alcaliphila TaxID=101564 RepID=A0A1G7E682_9GAMM|nr:zonular occludens toxin domain-containing protein [Pseudomonas alcaliphila]MDX5990721.1 zonular occludens toxin domain-containing protein [Pseudomonas alcaliphila]SDE59238.1 Zonular occludens toxin (Zot) [Pseudomonas alcaliphila]
MFVLRTGLQGNGKTLNTIKEVDAKAAKEGRPVYYHNIRGFDPNAEVLEAVWQEFDEPQKWHELPQNAMIVIDEAQTFFRVRPAGSAVPAYASALETMRHRGHELHCITQNPGLIDTHFRKLCNSHIHYVRGHKGKVIKRWEFERVNMDVEKKNDFSDGQATRVLLDKKYFGVYQSVAEGSEHHMKFKPPRALFVFIACIIGIGYFGYGIYERRIAPPKPQTEAVEQARATSPTGEPVAQQPAPNNAAPLSPEEYIALRVPRLPDVPSSAPIYDEITRPVTYPRLSCMYSTDPEMVARNHKRLVLGYRDGKVYGCRCNTQQGTRAVVSFEACMAYVEEGAFDPAKPDRLPDPNGQIAQTQPEQQPPQNQTPRPAPSASANAPVGAAWPSLSGYQGAL